MSRSREPTWNLPSKWPVAFIAHLLRTKRCRLRHGRGNETQRSRIHLPKATGTVSDRTRFVACGLLTKATPFYHNIVTVTLSGKSAFRCPQTLAQECGSRSKGGGSQPRGQSRDQDVRKPEPAPA